MTADIYLELVLLQSLEVCSFRPQLNDLMISTDANVLWKMKCEKRFDVLLSKLEALPDYILLAQTSSRSYSAPSKLLNL